MISQKDTDILRRSRILRPGKRGSGPVVYWMHRDQRIHDNWALLFAQQEALISGKPLHIVFCLTGDRQGSGLRHLDYLLKGLAETKEEAATYQIGFSLLSGEPEQTLPDFLQRCDAHLLVGDFLPLRFKQRWVGKIIEKMTMPYHEVDSHNIIPAWLTSPKREYGAYTIRPKIGRLLPGFLTGFPDIIPHPHEGSTVPAGSDRCHFTASLTAPRFAALPAALAGEKQARLHMRNFLQNGLNSYPQLRNNPNHNGQSGLSPSLHFGHLSPQRLALEVMASATDEAAKKVFLEELIVRRELADNFCLYEPAYDRIDCFPDWARKTLAEHRLDNRHFRYTKQQLEDGETHERLWNSCQHDLVNNGKLHGYLRMYWAKKILEWTTGADEALEYAILFNDTYSIDGHDPNGYAGIAWSIGGVHDRAWPERPVFGKIRYMNEQGCRRKFNIDQYIATYG